MILSRLRRATLFQPFAVRGRTAFSLPSLLNYTINHDGPLTSTGGCEGLAWVKTKYADKNDDWPDIEFHFVAGTPITDDGIAIRKNFGVTEYIWNRYYVPLTGKPTWQVIPMLLRPLSRGTIRLSSADPYAKPLIDPKYLSEVQDLNVLIEGVKMGLALSRTTAFQKLGTKFYDKPFPGCEGYTLWTDEYWACFIRHFTSTIYHPVGTCKMGPANDPTAVVDPQLRVYGIQGLRVADCSIMPTIPSGNTNAPAVRNMSCLLIIA